jgi:tRNA pseudouridine(38-40) synthase
MFRNAHKFSFLASSRMFSRIKGTGDKSLPTNDFSKALTGDVPFVKRKVALVCSFVGTNYKGMQYNPGTSTIESNLISSLTEIGCILPSNSLDPSKISWSRSSRTDKGVHAARLIVAAKLEVHPKWINEITLKLKEVPRLVNEKLPPDIRVFSCVKVNGSFDARYEVDWREYEYIIPLDVLTLNTSALTDKGELHTPDDLLGRLNAQLVKMEGTHSFHNFHRESAKKNNRIPKKKDDQNSPYVEAVEPVPQTFDSSDTEDLESIEEDDVDAAVDQEGESNVNGQQSIDPFIKHSNRRYLKNWQPVERSSSHRETKTIFRMRASLFDLSCAGDQKGKQTMVRIAVKGNSFLLQ